MTVQQPESQGTVALQVGNISRLAAMTGVAIALQCLLLAPANATSVCRWINEKGQTEISDVVPYKYRGVVSCTHTEPARPAELSAQQRAAAEASKRRHTAVAPTEKPASGAAAAPAPAAASQLGTKPPAEVVTDKTDCATWQRIFVESGACFAPFRTATGGIKAEAFAQCTEVPSPAQKCGPQRN